MSRTGIASIETVLRSLPSVDELLTGEPAVSLREAAGDRRLAQLARSALESMRSEIKNGKVSNITDTSSREQLLKEAGIRLKDLWSAEQSKKLQRVINATGVIVHTNLGRAPLSEAARTALLDGSAACTLEYDLETGKRGRRSPRAEELLCEITGAEAAVIVNNGAAAAFLVLSVFAAGREVIVSRGELVEIGGDFRIPDVLVQSGAVLREVGTTNRTKPKDYEAAINEDTGLILKVHPSNYKITGFTESPSLAALAELAQRRGLLLYEDAGSGALVDLSSIGLTGEPVISNSIDDGAAIVSFSGDKLLGGPQAGLIVGRGDLIERIRKHPLYRALRVDKLIYTALEATLESYARGTALDDVPVLRMASTQENELQARTRRFVTALNGRLVENAPLSVQTIDGYSVVGGGAAPGLQLPSVQMAVSHIALSAAQLEQALRSSSPPVISRIENDKVLLDLRTVSKSEEPELLEILCGLSEKC